jgi:sulfur carrier protein
MIRITVNGRNVELNESMTVEQMLDRVEVPPNYLAVEVNAEVVPREEYTAHVIQNGDQIELVTLVGGGLVA